MTTNRTKLAALAAIATIAGGMTPVVADAAVVINIVQNGNDVIATGSGSIDLANSMFRETFSGVSGVSPSQNFVRIGSGASDIYAISPDRSPAMGRGGFTEATSSSGDFFGIFAPANIFFVPKNYVSGSVLRATTTFANKTIATLGFNVGSYVFKTASDSFTVNVGVTSAVPEPASWAMMIVGFGVIGGTLRRRGGQRAHRVSPVV